MNYNKKPLGWLVTEDVFDPRCTGKCESIFAQGNGYINIRCALEEDYIASRRGTFITGTFNKAMPDEVTELPNLPDVTEMELMINGERFSMDQGTLKEYSRTLDLRTGEVIRTVQWTSPKGADFELKFHRFVSLANEHIAAIRVDVTPLSQNAEVVLESGISTRSNNTGSQHCVEGEMRMLEGGLLRLTTHTNESNIPVAVHCQHRFAPEPAETLPVMQRRRFVGRYTFQLEKNATLHIEKLACYHTGRDLPFTVYGQQRGTTNVQEVSNLGDCLARSFAETNYNKLLEDSAEKWKEYWLDRDVKIESPDSFDQLGMRFALYHLNIMIKRDDDRVGIGAKGMTGEGYKGHSFWDTEMFLMPHYLLTDPDAARTLMRYRWKSLPGAFRKAAENGYQGAMFPWESAWLDDGEVTPLFGGADVLTGKSIPILTGMIEHHITADVAWGVWLYYQATADDEFMEQCGCELLIEAARFWASRVEWQKDTQRYEIKNVIGPDEYKEHVDNNAFTNYLAVFSMGQAVKCIEGMNSRWHAAKEKLGARYDLCALAAELQDKARKVYLPLPNADGIVPQNGQYLDLEQIDLTKYKNQQGVSSIYEDYSPIQMNKLMVSKQADLVMLLRIMPDLFDAQTRRKNFMFYESRTLHDSSLSHGQHCVLAAWEGLDEMALDMYRHAIAIDLGPNMKSSDEGIHSASMGNIWQCVVCGFAGVEWHEGALSLKNHLPTSWKSISFRIVWHGAKMEVTVTLNQMTVRHLGGSEVTITMEGKEHIIHDGECVVEEKV